jgi:hypothetical protein
MTLRIREEDYAKMRSVTSLSFSGLLDAPPETGCILLVGRTTQDSNSTLIVADVLEPREGEFDYQGADRLDFSSRYLRRALFEVRDRRLAGFLTVHTHPFSTRAVQFSPYDNACDPELMANLAELQPTGIFGSIVLGKESANARLWNPVDQAFKALGCLVKVGERIECIPLDGTAHQPIDVSVEQIFDRARDLTGSDAWLQLSRMRIGVVGAGGTGSLVVELLARAGLKDILLFDFDLADITNMNRVLHLRQTDVANQRRKADRLREVIAESGLPACVSIDEVGDIRNATSAERLTTCDVLIGCVDRDWPRLVLCEVSYQYLIPYIDIGTEIGLSNGEVGSLDVRASFIHPGAPCLVCRGIVSLERVRLEGYTDEELSRIISMGYSADIRLKAPAVMELNMKAASWASLLLRNLIQPFLASPLPHCIRESLTNFSTRLRNYQTKSDCPICADLRRLGSGSSYPLTVGK